MGDPAFNTKAFTFGTAMPALVAWIAAAIANAWNNATAAFEASSSAASSAVDAATAAGQALAASNFKDEWDKLAALPNPADRVLNKPACVKNDGRFWALRVNLADVALSEPSDANTDWVSLDAGITPSRVITTNTPAVPGVRYTLGANNIELDISGVVYAKGVYQGIRVLDGLSGCSIKFGALKYMGRDIGTLNIDLPMFRLDINFENSTVGMQ